MNVIIDLRASLGLAAILVAAILGGPKNTIAAEASPPFAGAKSTWHDGFDRYDFVMDEESLSITPFTGAGRRKIRGRAAAEGAAAVHRGGTEGGGSRQPLVVARLLLGP